MSTSLKNYLDKEKRFSWIPLFLLVCAIIFVLSYNYIFPAPQLYDGYIRLEPASERGKPYISFHPGEDRSGRGFMVLMKDPAFNARVEAMLDTRVQVKALLFRHEPADFDKIEIFEINSLEQKK
ncbi:MAG: hypothetical protein CVV42_00575 [Candidatus Riflebacteria bacterium HGW-Riflebacteria-2]|jgi:hypothetical protein|nr:MAG: hypothetical protein CVV42_00575 [Candidatus Riflebacteria bacterium HGW-Riflebacteria-2]